MRAVTPLNGAVPPKHSGKVSLRGAAFYKFLHLGDFDNSCFFLGEFDKSCEEANAEDDAMCNVFSTYYLDVETPWMIVAPLEEIEPTVNS